MVARPKQSGGLARSSLRLRSTQNLECAITIASIAIDRKVIVEARLGEPKALHHGEARTVHDRKVLIRKSFSDRPGNLEVGGCDLFHLGNAAPYRKPELLRSLPVQPDIQQ